ncbi:four-carbon acid sugar kinase family protein [Thermoanaerobacterium thermosaccharolyticum]|uniref:four-carbon acid sugar kinase family protein n=1 Tax=Thermoanaerobacterium thermosaccharolyticum TaxID=1517 RepID=UPI003D2E1889
MAFIGAVADDLTGATTVGVLLARAGIKTAAFFNVEDITTEDTITTYEAIIVSTNSRALSKEEARKRVRDATCILKKTGIKQFSKRIDTTLRGGIGIEIDAMLSELGSNYVAIMVPAMPQSNRIMVGGYSIINSVPLSKTPVANDVRTPVRDSYVPRLIGNQTNRKIGHIVLDELFQGKENLKKALSATRESGAEILLVDAATLEDIKIIAEAVVELQWDILAVDPGPFTEAITSVKGIAKKENKLLSPIQTKSENYKKIDGTVLVVAGSASPITAIQMSTLKEFFSTYQVSINTSLVLKDGEIGLSEIEETARQILSVLNRNDPPKIVLIETALNGRVLNLSEEEEKYGLPPGQAANNINFALGEIVYKVLDEASDKVIGLYTTGGDTMVSVCKAIEAKGIELLDYVIPQADFGRIIGGKFNRLNIIGKGGLTGNEKTAVDCVNRLFEEGKERLNLKQKV